MSSPGSFCIALLRWIGQRIDTRALRIFLTLASLFYFCGPPIFSYIGDRLGWPFANPFDDRPFDSVAWKRNAVNAQDARKRERGPMVDDLIRRHVKPGMGEERIRQLLGSPDSIATANNPSGLLPYVTKNRVLFYNLGAWSGLGMDEDVLAVLFDDKGEIVSVWRFQT